MTSFPGTEKIFTIIAKSTKDGCWVSPTPRTFRGLAEANEFINRSKKDLDWDALFSTYRVLHGEVLL